jgi:hypothetical protein
VLADLLGSLEGLELNKNYPLQRLVSVLTVGMEVKEKELLVVLGPMRPPSFQKKVRADSYYYEVFVLWMDQEGNVCGVSREGTEWVQIKEVVQGYEFRFKQPETTKYFMICLSIEAGKENKKIGMLGGKGMRVMKVGRLVE